MQRRHTRLQTVSDLCIKSTLLLNSSNDSSSFYDERKHSPRWFFRLLWERERESGGSHADQQLHDLVYFYYFFKCDAVYEIQRGREKKGPTVFLYGQVGICAISSDALLMFPLL